MISDRDYMRDDDGPKAFRGGAHAPAWRSWSASTWIMVILVICFCIQQIVMAYGNPKLLGLLMLSSEGIRRGMVWQWITFQFLHSDLLHLVFNLLGIWFFGRLVESWFGSAKFLYAYLVGGILGGLIQTLLGLVFRNHAYPVLGASAGISTVLAICCRMEPNMTIQVWFVPVVARYFLIASVAIAAFFVVVPNQPSVAHGAHLGGLLFGILFVHLGWHRDFVGLPGLNWISELRDKLVPKSLSKKAVEPTKSATPSAKVVPVPKAPVNQLEAEVDAILDKIAAQGIHSLTDKERKLLESAREWLARRGR